MVVPQQSVFEMFLEKQLDLTSGTKQCNYSGSVFDKDSIFEKEGIVQIEFEDSIGGPKGECFSPRGESQLGFSNSNIGAKEVNHVGNNLCAEVDVFRID